VRVQPGLQRARGEPREFEAAAVAITLTVSSGPGSSARAQ
jgi:hypothetical protein